MPAEDLAAPPPDWWEDEDEAGIAVVIEAPGWAEAGLEGIAMRAGQAALDWLGCSDAGFVVLGCDDARIAALNADFRGKAQPTNVLSWPAEDHPPRPAGTPPPAPGAGPLGDIAIAWGVCNAEARAAGRSFADHVAHLLVHGVLHLAGYDHENDADAALMEGAERVILARLGIADPYADQVETP